MNNEPSYIIINLDGVRINIRLRSGTTLLPLVPKMTGSWRLAECTSPIVIFSSSCKKFKVFPFILFEKRRLAQDIRRPKAADSRLSLESVNLFLHVIAFSLRKLCFCEKKSKYSCQSTQNSLKHREI